MLALGIFMIYTRYEQIKSGDVGTFDTALIAIIAGLMLIPFFSEINILGVKLKQEISSLKTEVTEFREVVKNVIDVSNSNRFSPSIYFGQSQAPPDNQLEKIEEYIKYSINQVMEQNINLEDQNIELDVPEDNMLLFSARYNIEKEIHRIWDNHSDEYDDKKSRYVPIHRIVSYLTKYEILPPSFNGVIKEIYSVCSPAVHGEKPTESQVKFIKDVSADVIRTLKGIR
ncbi:MAG: hypothetical protein FH761_07500 [Firmicutes bacterium]|nr:hypothetical protein [Bacillota bacterium]